MNAQMTFFAQPKARRSDGVTAHAAAKRVESGNGALMQAIRQCVSTSNEPLSAFDIAALIRHHYYDPARIGKRMWKHTTILTAVSRAPFLRHVDDEGRVPDTGNACRRYVLQDGA